MKPFQVLTKPNCPKCKKLKSWLNSIDAKYEEWNTSDVEIQKKLIRDEKFVQSFCDVDGCLIYTPVVRLDETGNYYHKELWDETGLNADFLKDLLEL
ncbi:MAG: glutaredoxin domain-containing protein [Candidatus Hodarchaeota archaeon]